MARYMNNPKTNGDTAPELVLYRPKIYYGKIVMWFVVVLLSSYLVSLLVTLMTGTSLDAIHLESLLLHTNENYLFCLFVVLFLSSRYVCIFAVRLYQRYAKSEVRLRCRMTPSCSDYSIMAFQKYGTIIGLIKTVMRLKRCNNPAKIDFP